MIHYDKGPSAVLYVRRDENKKKENKSKWDLIAVKTVKQQNEFIPEVMEMPFGKVSKNSLSVQADCGQRHQL